jgi:methyl-accepting chemotaxis protein
MKILRRFLGVFVMIAGLIGLVISLAGLVGVWVARPAVVASVNSTIATLNTSVDTSQKAMDVTNQALGATVESVDALSAMLGTTAKSVEDTKPVFAQMNTMMEVQLPTTLQATMDSLRASQEAAASMESAMQSLDTFRAVMSATPFLSAFVPASQANYAPDKPLADSLGEVAASLEDMPITFVAMADNMDKADDNLDLIQGNLNTMSGSVGMISDSLREYQSMIGQSRASMENLRGMLSNIQNNLESILNWTTLVLYLLLFWMLAAQVVIFSQGWELYQGTAGRMESGPVESTTVTPVSAD